jgi:Tfp pilus assembly protein PilE
MNVDFQQPVGMRGIGSPGSSERGFSALELLVIVVIVCVLVAIGVPALHSRAKASVLSANLQSLGAMVNEQVMEGYSTEYRQSGEGDPSSYLSTHLEEGLSTAGKAGYTNPVVGSEKGRVILSSRSVPTDPQSVPPAVFITDSPQCLYLSFSALARVSWLSPESIEIPCSGALDEPRPCIT